MQFVNIAAFSSFSTFSNKKNNPSLFQKNSEGLILRASVKREYVPLKSETSSSTKPAFTNSLLTKEFTADTSIPLSHNQASLAMVSS
ncbi:Uncharacterised protein [Segatella copri]|nr:Uncharacterised protein [Segatella copri]